MDSVTGLIPIGPDEPLYLLEYHNQGTRHSESHQAGAASARSLVFPSWIHTRLLGFALNSNRKLSNPLLKKQLG